MSSTPTAVFRSPPSEADMRVAGPALSALRLPRHHFHRIDKIAGFSKAGGRDAAVLTVMEHYRVAEGPVDLFGHVVVPNREMPDGRCCGPGRDVELTFPGLTDPTFARKLV